MESNRSISANERESSSDDERGPSQEIHHIYDFHLTRKTFY